MVTISQFRALALSLPGAEEKAHFGKADFRVQNKIFAGLAPGGRSGAGADQPERGYFKARPELREELLGGTSADGRAFSPAEGAWGKSGWTYVELARVEPALLRELLVGSWELVVPAQLARQGSTGRKRTGKGRGR